MRKTFLVFVFAVLAITATLGFTACGSATEKSEKNDHDMNGMDHSNMDQMDHGDMDGKEHKTTDFSAYKKGDTEAFALAGEQIDKALAEKDKDKAIEGAKSLLTAFEKFDASKLDESKKKEYEEIAESAKEHAEHITKSDMKHQIEHFEGLAKDLTDLFALIGEKKEA